MNRCRLFWALALAALLGTMLSHTSYAFPSNTRLGYSNCGACHVSPTGGGVLTQYGQMTAADFLSTWSYKGEAKTAHGLFGRKDDKPKRVLVGGDLRHVRYKYGNYYRQINMQADLELAVLYKKFSFVTSFGLYAKAKDHEFQIRRNYLLYKHNDNLALRFGKFYPAYGIHHEDHTVATRKALRWDQGGETLNAEVSLNHRRGELFVTANLGKADYIVKLSEATAAGVERGLGARGAYYLGHSSQLGLSAYYGKNAKLNSDRLAYGPYAMLGFLEKAYALLEVDRQQIKGTPAEWIAYQLLGVEAFKGLHLQAFHESVYKMASYGLKLQWFPRPHWELTAGYEKAKAGNTMTGLLHYYF